MLKDEFLNQNGIMQELKDYLKSRIESSNKELKSGKNTSENIQAKEDLSNAYFMIDMINKYNINPKNISEIITIKTATDSSEIRLFDDCDTEDKKCWKELGNLRLSSGDIIIKFKF